ncbi:MAG: hypothetical protein KY464_01135 [Gemmatimonadetes bacterium]|nr:hypothetical protein [Gemmatimonadota bacterium]
MVGMLITLFVLGILGFVAVSVVLGLMGAVFGLVFGLAGFLLFKVAPVILIGWVVLKIIGKSRHRDRISPADQKWLDS